jgi:hypothetical protein
MKAKRFGALAANYRHGHADTPIYKIWQGMRGRCSNRNNANYPEYGGRGIRVCEAWDRSFQAFLNDVGPRPSPAHSIDRIDNDGNYEPGNVRWATDREQNNNSRNCHWIEHNGIRDTVAGWASRLGCSTQVLRVRLHQKWPIPDVLSPPFVRQRPKRHSKRYEFQGESLTIPEWAKRTGIPRNTLALRIKAGWSLERALTAAVRPY